MFISLPIPPAPPRYEVRWSRALKLWCLVDSHDGHETPMASRAIATDRLALVETCLRERRKKELVALLYSEVAL